MKTSVFLVTLAVVTLLLPCSAAATGQSFKVNKKQYALT